MPSTWKVPKDLAVPKDLSYQKCARKPECSRTQKDGPLRVCLGCKLAKYCSKGCQRADWAQHKELCRLNQANQQIVRDIADNAGIADEVDDFESRVNKWVLKWHHRVLGFALLSSLRLPTNPQAQKKQLLLVDAHYIPNVPEQHCLAIKNMQVSTLEEMKVHNPLCADQLTQAGEMPERIEEERKKGNPNCYGTGLVMVRFSKDGLDGTMLRVLPFTFEKDSASRTLPGDWYWKACVLLEPHRPRRAA